MVPVVPFSDFFAAIVSAQLPECYSLSDIWLCGRDRPKPAELSMLVISLKGHAAVAEILDRANENHPPHRDAERHLRSAIHNEESERREGEDWSIAREYVHSLSQQTKSEDAA